MCYTFACRLRKLLEVHVLIMEYPGYGICPGKPSEESLHKASQTCLSFVTEVLRIPPSDVIIVGRSLGAAVALQAAAASAVCGLVLIAPFLSLQDALGQFTGKAASKLLVNKMFCNREVIKAVKEVPADELEETSPDTDKEDEEAADVEGSWASDLLLAILRFYRKFISPLLPPNCRYVPSCSRYGIEVVKRYGALKGSVLFAWRLLRCTPLFPVDRSRIVWAYGRFCMSDEPEDFRIPLRTAKTVMLKKKEKTCDKKCFVSPPGMGHNDDLMASAELLWRPMVEFFALPAVTSQFVESRKTLLELLEDPLDWRALQCACRWRAGRDDLLAEVHLDPWLRSAISRCCRALDRLPRDDLLGELVMSAQLSRASERFFVTLMGAHPKGLQNPKALDLSWWHSHLVSQQGRVLGFWLRSSQLEQLSLAQCDGLLRDGCSCLLDGLGDEHLRLRSFCSF
ncbi:unnamed protein product [Symbiodinium pilosum]|uniref:AB hydrolase-1 domain-containing protein n=1 Tax=Symbiodinium pilosum TaxID=2952 RepID=A0A812X8S1_SYMPI|nr:unnamed protein product [Symbiodinium pilosum]